ncbi:MAG: endolytic transglycosylase MltG [Alicyclobacillaceae bacterium]|nr:endolytic transglycosylase MltG [Alicyclobacillaceae bacterium]
MGRVFALAAGVFVLGVAAACAWAYQATRPPAPGGLVAFDVRPGESGMQIAAALRQAGLVRSTVLYATYLRLTGRGRHMQAGHYEIRRGSSWSEIAAQLEGGLVADNTVRVTIPEGYTVVQIADALAKAGVCPRAAFLRAEQRDRFDEPFLRQIPHNPKVKYRLEGYLFPDTYDFVRGEKPHDVINTMLQNFARRVDAPMMTAMRRQGLTLPEAITEASLIEREAKVDKERPVIASVINNRLKRGMKLQIDATVEYVVGHRDRLTDRDLTVNDPYNTYLHPGLPPGPIANPGMASIEAAIHPAHTPYLYYVVKNDGSGEDYFATTYAEQLRNIRRSEENLRRALGEGGSR